MPFSQKISPFVQNATVEGGSMLTVVTFPGTAIHTEIHNTEAAEGPSVEIYLNDLDDSFALGPASSIILTSHLNEIAMIPSDGTSSVDVSVISSVVV